MPFISKRTQPHASILASSIRNRKAISQSDQTFDKRKYSLPIMNTLASPMDSERLNNKRKELLEDDAESGSPKSAGSELPPAFGLIESPGGGHNEVQLL